MEKSLYTEWFLRVKYNRDDFFYLGRVSEFEEVKNLLDKLKELHEIKNGESRSIEENLRTMYDTIRRESRFFKPKDISLIEDDWEYFLIVPHHLYTVTLKGIEAKRFMRREYADGSGVVGYFSSKFGLPENITRFVFVVRDSERKSFIEDLEKKAEELYGLDEAIKNGRHYRI